MATMYEWHEVYKAALLETDWSRMDERVRTAEATLEDRKRVLELDHDSTPGESKAIEDAIKSLHALRAEAASWLSQNKTSQNKISRMRQTG